MHRYLPALFQTYGHEVTSLPVNDRARLAGKSKYNNLNRALVGVYDLVGVTWLRRRTVVPAIAEALPEGSQVSELTSRLKPRGSDPPTPGKVGDAT
jgi:dolichol-phosphate mannosyltransferase